VDSAGHTVCDFAPLVWTGSWAHGGPPVIMDVNPDGTGLLFVDFTVDRNVPNGCGYWFGIDGFGMDITVDPAGHVSGKPNLDSSPARAGGTWAYLFLGGDGTLSIDGTLSGSQVTINLEVSFAGTTTRSGGLKGTMSLVRDLTLRVADPRPQMALPTGLNAPTGVN